MRLDAERQLLPLLGRLHRLGRELGDVGNEGHLGRDDELRRGIKDQPHLGPQLDPAGPVRGQEEGHVDVVEINHVQHLPARGQHLAGLGDTILHATGARRLQCTIVDVRLDSFDRRLGGFDSRFRRDDRAPWPWRWRHRLPRRSPFALLMAALAM